MKNTFAEKNKKIRLLSNRLELSNTIIKSQIADTEKKDAIMSIQEMDIKRLKQDWEDVTSLVRIYKTMLKNRNKEIDKYHEIAELTETRCNKKSLHIRILYAVLTIGSIFIWSIR